MTSSLDEAIIHSWQLDGSDFLCFARDVLGPLLLDYGLLAPWRYCSLLLQLEDNQFHADDLRTALDISNNAQSLLAELIALGDQNSLKNQVRILGLLCILIGSGSEIPATTTRQIVVSRDALDLFSLSCLNSRNHELANLVFSAVNSADNSSRGLDALVDYLSILESPLIHRYRIISHELRLDITPWPEMTEVIVGLRKTAELAHDRKYIDAEPIMQSLIDKYPSCPEVSWMANIFQIYAANPPRWQQKPLDPLAFYRADQFSKSGINIIKHALPHPKVMQCCDQILNSFSCGFDPSVSTHACSCLINQFYHAGNSTDVLRLIKKNSDDIISRSNYDPFELALFSSQLGDLKSIQSSYRSGPKHDDLIDIVFVVGLPHTCWFDVEKKLNQVPNVATVMSNAVVDHIGKRLAELHKDNNPSAINQLAIENINELRNFYLQNLSFLHGGRSVDFVIDLIPNAFKHIGLLSVIFPESKFLILNFEVEELILSHFTTIDGFTSGHATSTLGELVAYVLDYAHIVDKWKSLLEDRLSFLSFSCSVSADIVMDAILTSLNSLELTTPCDFSLGSVNIRSRLPSLSEELMEYKDDILEINQLLFPVK